MSQNHVELRGPAGLPVNVCVGFDRRLNELFCNVLADEADESDYSGACMFNAQSVDEIGKVLDSVGLKVPVAVLKAANEDMQANRQTVVRRFDAEGNLLTEQFL
jgi:hypothetical protein